jgi:hypothetical protein
MGNALYDGFAISWLENSLKCVLERAFSIQKPP